jgi:hypothetical protein
MMSEKRNDRVEIGNVEEKSMKQNADLSSEEKLLTWESDAAGHQVGLTCMHVFHEKTDFMQHGLNVVCPKSYYETNHCIPFILDSGASCHMTPERELFTSLEPCRGKVMMGDSNVLDIEGKGQVNLLGNVIYVPGLKYSLISISVFDKMRMRIVIEDGILSVYERGQTVPCLKGFRCKNLYWLYAKYVKRICTPMHVKVFPLKPDQSNQSAVVAKTHPVYALINIMHGKKSIEALHRKWGHISYDRIREAIRKNMVVGHNMNSRELAKIDSLSMCVPCMEGRMKARNALRSNEENHVWDILEKIGIDFKGYFPVSFHGYRGFFLLSDKQSNYVYVYMVKKRSEALQAISAFNDFISYHHKVWKVLQSDSDSVFIDKAVRDWLNSHHIKLQLSTPYNHWQNGQIERDVQSVMDTARTLMAASRAPPSYWYHAVKYACYVINRSPSKGHDKTPYEYVTGEKPDVSNFVPFYCPGVYHCTKEERKHKAWAYKAEPCRMLGYDENTKDGYIVLKVRNGEILTRRDCIFDEAMDVKQILLDTDLEEYLEDKDYSDVFDLVDPSDETENQDKEAIIGNPPDLSTSVGEGRKLIDVDETVEPSRKKSRNEDLSDTSSEGATDCEFTDDELDYFCLRMLLAENLDDGVGGYDYQTCILMWYYDLYANMSAILKLPPQPKSVSEALKSEHREEWLRAIEKEIDQLHDRGVFEFDDTTGRALKSKIVLRVSLDNNLLLKFKARLVVCGYAQRKGIDFKETFSPTTCPSSLFLLLSICSSQLLFFAGFDVTGAFLEGENDVDLYIIFPREITTDENYPLRMKVVKSLYGEKQAPKIWNEHIHNILIRIGWQRSPVDACLYKKEYLDGRVMYLIIHVDDGFVISTSQEALNEFFDELKKSLTNIVVYKEMPKFLGLDIRMEDNVCYVSQQSYINDKIRNYVENNKKVVNNASEVTDVIPMSSSCNLKVQARNEKNESLLPVSGMTRFLADRTRPDISVAVGEFSSGGADQPSDLHIKVAHQTLRYLLREPELALKLGGDKELNLFGFCDASFISVGNAKSRG